MASNHSFLANIQAFDEARNAYLGGSLGLLRVFCSRGFPFLPQGTGPHNGRQAAKRFGCRCQARQLDQSAGAGSMISGVTVKQGGASLQIKQAVKLRHSSRQISLKYLSIWHGDLEADWP